MWTENLFCHLTYVAQCFGVGLCLTDTKVNKLTFWLTFGQILWLAFFCFFPSSFLAVCWFYDSNGFSRICSLTVTEYRVFFFLAFIDRTVREKQETGEWHAARVWADQELSRGPAALNAEAHVVRALTIWLWECTRLLLLSGSLPGLIVTFQQELKSGCHRVEYMLYSAGLMLTWTWGLNSTGTKYELVKTQWYRLLLFHEIQTGKSRLLSCL